MAFIKEKISESDRVIFNSYNLKNPITRETLNSRRWTIDRERNAFLVALGGQGIYGSEIPMYYALIWNGKVITLETFSKATGSNSTGMEFYWKITKIEAPECLLKDKDEMMNLIKEAFIAYDIGDTKVITSKFNFDFIASPWFIKEVNK